MKRILRCSGLVAALLAGAAPAQSLRDAGADNTVDIDEEKSDFQLFEHQVATESDRAEAYVDPAATFTRSTTAFLLSRQGSNASFREAIYAASIREAEIRYALPSGLLRALIWQESRFNPMAVSPAGAAGLAQLMPATARYLGVSNRHDPRASIDGGARYLREMLDKFGAIHLALAAYNAGPGAVMRAKGIPRNNETPGYVQSVLARWKVMVR
ncbi:lytic transglycosylase domain-containing protein [Novosphingopyxis sp.]|uniref:lytic transglycosylase domain-containing protein n=1 Tax=Novosphingopyxis sp. TaxID=2709690 RepID=UPI003B591003